MAVTAAGALLEALRAAMAPPGYASALVALAGAFVHAVIFCFAGPSLQFDQKKSAVICCCCKTLRSHSLASACLACVFCESHQHESTNACAKACGRLKRACIWQSRSFPHIHQGTRRRPTKCGGGR